MDSSRAYSAQSKIAIDRKPQIKVEPFPGSFKLDHPAIKPSPRIAAPVRSEFRVLLPRGPAATCSKPSKIELIGGCDPKSCTITWIPIHDWSMEGRILRCCRCTAGTTIPYESQCAFFVFFGVSKSSRELRDGGHRIREGPPPCQLSSALFAQEIHLARDVGRTDADRLSGMNRHRQQPFRKIRIDRPGDKVIG